MRKIIFLAISYFIAIGLRAQEWKIAGNTIRTPWSEQVKPDHPLPEYPRPQMIREGWINLNGLWDYAIRYKDETRPDLYPGKILVPFAIESALSGVGKTVGENNNLWYRKKFSIPAAMKGKNILLHFGAVDWEAEIFINGKKAILHQGGYDPFYVDITPFIIPGKEQEIIVRVWDPSDNGPQPIGKQRQKPSGIWYTSVTGIWQTVWVEAVTPTHIKSIYTVPDIDHSTIVFYPSIEKAGAGDQLKIAIYDGSKKILEKSYAPDSAISIMQEGLRLWSPETPVLYDYTASVVRGDKTIDEVKGYFAMRKISLHKDDQGIQWIMLNNAFRFQFGPLDQGWWPDGLYTAPTDEALKFDILKTREMGFNMIRKHTKVEPARWYRYCDSLGMLVWQDMPSGDMNFSTDKWITNPSLEPIDKTRTPASEEIYRRELKAMIDNFRVFPCIVIWVPFNEAWGQFKTVEIARWTKEYDPSRLVNPASGGNFHAVGDLHDLHNYPDPVIHRPEVFGKDRAVVLGEFGGLGLPVEHHTWTDRSNWGYQSFGDQQELFNRYKSLLEKLQTLIPKGLSAAVYTQTTDVESEVNGLMTYDRKVMKFDIEAIRALNQKLYSIKK
jgi:beta-galactosidase/beta-glucuronidase